MDTVEEYFHLMNHRLEMKDMDMVDAHFHRSEVKGMDMVDTGMWRIERLSWRWLKESPRAWCW
jgi:hypothetical protein